MPTKDNSKKLSDRNPAYADRFEEEYRDHVEDEKEFSVFETGKNVPRPHDDMSKALLESARDQKNFRRKRRIGWVLLCVAFLHHLLRTLLSDTVPLFSTFGYVFFGGAGEVFVIALAVLRFFPSFGTKLFRE